MRQYNCPSMTTSYAKALLLCTVDLGGAAKVVTFIVGSSEFCWSHRLRTPPVTSSSWTEASARSRKLCCCCPPSSFQASPARQRCALQHSCATAATTVGLLLDHAITRESPTNGMPSTVTDSATFACTAMCDCLVLPQACHINNEANDHAISPTIWQQLSQDLDVHHVAVTRTLPIPAALTIHWPNLGQFCRTSRELNSVKVRLPSDKIQKVRCCWHDGAHIHHNVSTCHHADKAY